MRNKEERRKKMTYTQAVEKACNGDSTGFEFLYDTTKNNKYYLAL